MEKIILQNVVFLSREAINLILLREFGTGNKIGYGHNGGPNLKVQSVVLKDGDVEKITINGKDYPGVSIIGILQMKAYWKYIKYVEVLKNQLPNTCLLTVFGDFQSLQKLNQFLMITTATKMIKMIIKTN